MFADRETMVVNTLIVIFLLVSCTIVYGIIVKDVVIIICDVVILLVFLFILCVIKHCRKH